MKFKENIYQARIQVVFDSRICGVIFGGALVLIVFSSHFAILTQSRYYLGISFPYVSIWRLKTLLLLTIFHPKLFKLIHYGICVCFVYVKCWIMSMLWRIFVFSHSFSIAFSKNLRGIFGGFCSLSFWWFEVKSRNVTWGSFLQNRSLATILEPWFYSFFKNADEWNFDVFFQPLHHAKF